MRLAGLLFVALIILASPAYAERQSIALERYVGNLVVVHVEIAGQPAHLLFDTGAGVTFLTPAFAQRIGCEPFGHVVGFRMRGDQLGAQKCGEQPIRIGRYQVEREVGVLDLAALLPPDWPPLDGVMGLDVFDGTSLVLDLADNEIRLGHRSGSGWSEGAVRLNREMGGAGVTAFTRADANVGAIWLLMDSGNLGSVFLSPGALSQLNRTQTDQGSFSVTFAGAGPQEIEPEVAETLIYDGVLNYAFLRQFEISLDLDRSRVWWRPNR